jgi:hypothetical protein
VPSFLDGGRTPRTARPKQLFQNDLDPGFALPRGQVQDAQILLGRPLRVLLDQSVIDETEATGREQVVTVAVVGKSPRLAHQPVDDVPVVDAVVAPTTQPGQTLDLSLGIPDFDVVGVQAGLDPFADQPAGHRVGVTGDVDGAARTHFYIDTLTCVNTLFRQRSQQEQLLGQSLLPSRVQLGEQLPQEGFVVRALGKVPTAAQHQGLVQGPFEAVMALFGIAILMTRIRVGDLPLQAVMVQQRLIPLRECLPFLAWGNGGGEPVGAVQVRHTAQFPQRVLQAVTEAFQALAEADRAGLPVGVGQHEVEDQVREGLAADGDLQGRGVGEIGGAEPARFVDLGEEDLFGRPVQGAALLEAALESAELAIREASRMTALQVGQQGLGLQSGIEVEHLIEVRPDVGERVGAGAIVAVHASDLAGQFAEPPVLAGGLGIDVRLGGGLFLGTVLHVEAAQAAHLLIGDHPKPPCEEGLRIN